MTLCGTKLKTMFMGNAPCGFYKYKYRDSNAASDAVGVKVGGDYLVPVCI